MTFDPLRNRYNQSYFDNHRIKIDKERNKITINTGKASLAEDAKKCLKIWQSAMNDPSINHSLKDTLVTNISTLRTWVEKTEHPNEYPFKAQVDEAIAYWQNDNLEEADKLVCQMISEGCSREALIALKNAGYLPHHDPDMNPYLSELRAAFEFKNYDVAIYLLDQFPTLDFEMSLENSFYSVLLRYGPDLYLLEELVKRGARKTKYIDLVYELKQDKTGLRSVEELKRLYQFAIDNGLYEMSSLNSSLIVFISDHNEAMVKFLIAKGATFDSLYKPSFIQQIYNPDPIDALDLYALLDKYSFWEPQDIPQLFRNALLSSNIRLVKKLFAKLQPSTFTKKDWEEIWIFVQFSQNPKILHFALENLIPKTDPEILLNPGIEKEDPVFLDRVLKAQSFSQETLAKYYRLAIDTGNIKIIRLLAKNLTPAKPDETILEDIFQKFPAELTPDNRLYLNLLLLQSGYPDGVNFLRMAQTKYPKHAALLEELIQDSWNWIPYVGHFSPSLEKELNSVYTQTSASYIERQIQYGHKMAKLTKDTAANKPTTLRKTIIDHYANERAKIANQSDYAEIRDEHAETNMFGGRPKGRELISSRYAPFQNLCISHWEALHDRAASKETYSIGYTITYTPSKEETIPLTRCICQAAGIGWTWFHTNAEDTQKLWPHMEKLHAEVINFPVDPKDAKQVAQFKDKLAEAYWLGVHLMLTARGNSQYFQNWLADMCMRKGFKPPISSNKYPLVDCIALCLPLDEFKRDFSTYFDSLLEPQETKNL